ncbi:MAG: hypothetical protein IJS53_00955 [Clostridia bacterium]|nr:hypothetical protein [Clostridia bacterium]
MKAYKGWMLLLLLLLALGVALTVYGAIEHRRTLRLPQQHESTALRDCIFPQNLS